MEPPIEASPPAVATEGTATQLGSTRELVIIDSTVPDANQIADALRSGPESGRSVDVVVLASGDDGIARVSELLSTADTPYDSLHLISHGNSASAQLGISTLDSVALASRADEIAGWSRELTARPT
ncbi:MAG: DUF4347 domain-containing protein [Burkholderiaceae bacterium]